LKLGFAVSLLSLFLATLPTAKAQSVTGQISGSVTDPAGAVIPGARVQLTNDLTKQVRALSTASSGSFIFPDLMPGDYSVGITQTGFKAYSQRGINVSAAEKVALHDIRLELGDVNSTVTVDAQVAHVATDSSDRSIAVNTRQIENTPVRGRDWLGLMQALPGVVDLNLHDSPGWNSGAPTVNGGQTGQLELSFDGILSQDSGSPGSNGWMAPSLDAIAEVKVLVSNYAAEYGSRGGGQLVATVKNGTSQFHGSAYYFYRHETLNANEFINNLTGLAKPLYRYTNLGGTFGGPLLIPGTRFNKSRTKLFFFFSEDYLQFLNPSATTQFTMPTALERAGNYSQTTTTTGKPIPITDPTTLQPYPGNVIPASRISPAGFAMLNLFPLPFATDPTGQRQYNAIYQFPLHDPHEDRILRLDYNVAPNTQAFVRLMNDYQGDRGIGSKHNSTGAWGELVTDYGIQSAGAMATIIHTFGPNLVNEFTVGVNRALQSVSIPSDAQAQYQASLLPALRGPDGQPVTVPKIYNNNPENLIPTIKFTTLNAQSPGQAITNPPSAGFAAAYDTRYPFVGTDQLENITNNVSWIHGGHSAKFGFYFERAARNVTVYSLYGESGTYYFGSDAANINDTGYGFSNLLLGSVQAYGEDSTRFLNHARYNQVEWYAQDSWKVSRRVTLDLGVRFQLPEAIRSVGATLGLFDGSTYSASKAGVLLFPAVVNGNSVSINRTTGATYQLARAGFFDPASYPANGSPYSGMVQYHEQAFNNPGLAVGPRVGFAWDVLGNGKLALRGGFGIFYDRAFGVDTNGATSAGVGPIPTPPAFQAPTYYNTTLTQMLNAQGFLGPATVFAGPSYKNPATYNWSIGIQRDLGKGLILDVAYVGNVVHHKFVQVDRNGAAPFTDWTPTAGANPAYIDPTSGGKAFFTANLMRPTMGYGAINYTCSCGEANYNSLQTQLNRRLGQRLQFGANWTWSKTMLYTRGPWTPDYLSYAEVGSSRPQVVNISYSYQVPDGSRIWRNALTKTVLDGWHFNGITKLMSGNPLTVSCSAQSAPIGYWTGTPTGGIPFRCQMAGSDPFLSAGSSLPATAPQGRYYPLNAANFTLPPATSLGIGNTPPTLFYGPGFENFDFTLFKDMRLGKESRVLEFRAEAYNVLNHWNPGNPNTSLTLNYSTGANTNANFGTISTTTFQARHIALGVKLRF
jgi:Carboxypeptidase regulatory-like domain